MALNLPAWLTRRADGVFVVDPDLAYPAILGLLGVAESDYDQFWIETAYQCTKMAVQNLILGSELDPRPQMTLVIVIEAGGGRKGRWAMSKFKPGRGIQGASGTRSMHLPTAAKLSYRSIARQITESEAPAASPSRKR